MTGTAIRSLRVMSVVPSVSVLAPFLAVVIQVAGCAIGCRGCVSPDSWSADAGVPISIGRLAAYLRRIAQGIVLTGGEPTDQALPLCRLLDLVGPDPLVALYSGYSFERLEADCRPGVAELLARVDLISAGPYVAELAGMFPMAGSSNQKVLALSGRVDVPTSHLGVELIVAAGTVEVAGITPPGFTADWILDANSRGIQLPHSLSPSIPASLHERNRL